jgi:branched-chain amino acid transport system permease protein
MVACDLGDPPAADPRGVPERIQAAEAILSARALWIAIAVVLAAALIPAFGNAYITTIAFSVLIAFILAQSWDWVAGEMGYVNLGHFVFYGIGAYAFAIALVANYPAAVSAVFAFAATAIFAALISFPLFRLRSDYFAFGTLALLPLVEVLAFNLASITGGGDGISLPPQNVLRIAYWSALAVCVAAIAQSVWLNRVRFGYALKSIRNDEEVAEVMGIRILPVKIRVMVLSAGFASLAGAIQAWQMSYIDPRTVFGLHVALVPVAMALLGGSGLLWGPLIGVLLLSCMQQWLLVNVQGFQAAIYGTVILLIGRFMPGGILRAGWVHNLRWLKGLAAEHHERITGTQSAMASRLAGAELPLQAWGVDRSRPIIECRDLTMAFGGNVAINTLNLRVMQGEIVGLVGANGSGKTTLFNCISKVYEPVSGEVLLDGHSLARLRRDEVVHLGVGRTYQIPRPFGDLTVQENIAIPLMFRDKTLSPRQALELAREFVDYAQLQGRLTVRADTLSLQEKKALEFARALAARPKLLLVDEVASGLTPVEIRRFVEHVRHVRDRHGITVIWVEHIFSALAQVVDRVVVLEQGNMIADGTLEEVVQDERVLRTYLGSAAHGVPLRNAGGRRADA